MKLEIDNKKLIIKFFKGSKWYALELDSGSKMHCYLSIHHSSNPDFGRGFDEKDMYDFLHMKMEEE